MIYRDLTALSDLMSVVGLQKAVWRYTDDTDVVPLALLAVQVRRGGIVIGAFEGSQLVGFVFSMPSIKSGRLAHWSHMLGVLPDYRGRGTGRALKLLQRDRALAQGVTLIEWAFDPLQALNAHFNICELGAISNEFAVNLYGQTSSPVHHAALTDRLIARWHLDSLEVIERCSHHRSAPLRPPAEFAIVNRTAERHRMLVCESTDLRADHPTLGVAIPLRFGDIVERDHDLGESWRVAMREAFPTYFGRGYEVVDFTSDAERGIGSYWLRRRAARPQCGPP